MLPLYQGKTDKMVGAAISEFLMGEGIEVSTSTTSRIKRGIDDGNAVDRLESYQKLESYLKLVAKKHQVQFGGLKRRFMGLLKEPLKARLLYGLDGAHLKGEMNNYGVFLVTTAKDYNDHILPFAFSLEALGSIERFTVVSDRMKGLLSAVHDVYPKEGHRFCLRHIKGNINSHGISLTVTTNYLLRNFQKQKPATVDYLNGIDKKHWVKYKFQEQFKLPTYDEITSNLAEQEKRWIGSDCRSAKPMDTFAMYFRKLSELASHRRQMASN
ncbi:Uncharacterized protein PHPALM_6397 [Phytophthora palmivora]|uniref:MULE transposase domain-containing protein n=1 Tax=Phytophthora palmivora TaxID=4796 RepID=A0A2P4YEZ6_9STRA|nr:Uncharacterized protein PHPALM_6397 [Phytophthora palmivora]